MKKIDIPYMDLMVMAEKAIKYDTITRIAKSNSASYIKEAAINAIVGIEKQEEDDE